MSASKETKETSEKQTYCVACGNELRSYSILVCTECLDDECNEFLKLAQAEEQDSGQSNITA
jgi:hypothetical protein